MLDVAFTPHITPAVNKRIHTNPCTGQYTATITTNAPINRISVTPETSWVIVSQLGTTVAQLLRSCRSKSPILVSKTVTLDVTDLPVSGHPIPSCLSLTRKDVLATTTTKQLSMLQHGDAR